MQAQRLMNAHPVTASHAETVQVVLARMQAKALDLLPVLGADGAVVGVVTPQSIMAHIVPSYIVAGDLDDVPYAPDFGLLRRHYDGLLAKPVTEVLDEKPLTVRPDASLLSVAATLLTHHKYESALVVDEAGRLLGVVGISDVLAGMKDLPGGGGDA